MFDNSFKIKIFYEIINFKICMHNIVNNLILINKELSAINSNTKVIAVSKTFPIEHIKPAIDHGHIHLEKIKFKKQQKNGQKLKKKIIL